MSINLWKDFDCLIDDLRKEYNRVLENNRSLSKTLAEWNKNAELEELRRELGFCRGHALHECTDAELNAISEFRNRHYKSCKNGSTFQFELAGTGIGEAISIKCPVCGEEENVTDYSSW